MTMARLRACSSRRREGDLVMKGEKNHSDNQGVAFKGVLRSLQGVGFAGNIDEIEKREEMQSRFGDNLKEQFV